VKARYDNSTDIFYMLFKEGPSHEVVEADPDVHLELDETGKINGHRDMKRSKKRLE